jgi:hypothetical protein
VKLVLDAGAFVALERNDRALWRRLKIALTRGEEPTSHGGVIGQVWRGGGSRHALLSMALDAVDVRPLDAALGRAAGELLARARGRDVIDAALVLIADDGDSILTSDPDDLSALATAAERDVDLVVT